MVDLVVYHIEFVHIQPLNMVLILIRVIKVGFTGWLFLKCGQNHLVRKIIVDLVVNHIEFAHIQPLNMILILMLHFYSGFTGWLFFQLRSKPSVWKDHGRLSCQLYRHCPYLTTKYGFTGWLDYNRRSRPLWLESK